MRSVLITFCLVSLVGAPAVAAQETAVAEQESTLTLDMLFASATFSGERFGPARWLDENSYTSLERAEGENGGFDIVRYDAASGDRETMVTATHLTPEGAEEPLRISGYQWSDDHTKLLIFTNTRRVWRANTKGDYWVLDLEDWSLKQLGGDAPESSLMFAKFSPQADRVGYVSEHDLYVEDLENGAITRLTFDGSDDIINGTFDWVYEEELSLRDGFRWSPDGQRIAYWRLDATGVRDFLLINNTDSLYSFVIPVEYPKAGTTNSEVRIGTIPATGGTTTWCSFEGDPRNYYLARMDWAATPSQLIIQHLNRLQNTNTVTLCDAATGATSTIMTETEAAWLDPVDDVHWLDDGRRFTWVSERDGWRRVYVVSRDGQRMRGVTPAETDITSVELVDEDGGWIYYIASPENPTQRYLYRSRLDGRGRAERLSPADAQGTHGYTLAPRARYAFHTYSTFMTPPVISLVSLPRHRVVRTLAANDRLRETVAEMDIPEVEFFRVTVDSGVELDVWMMKPSDFDPSLEYPVLFYVYGEPWGQTVQDAWSGRQMLWYHYLAQKGYLIMSVDNRGTPPPRGREWRKVVYKQIGVLASQDQAQAVQAIAAERSYVDLDRIGIWGWSGGGSMTLNCMFRYPEIYRTGMAVAPVPDLRYYDTIYQERYMGLPQDEPEAYAQSSPITFANQLEGNLLVVHGTGDDNVHYQGTEALINELVANNKQFTMMAYPNRSHGIFEGRGTTRHLYGLLTRYLLENLPPGGRAAQLP